MKYLCKFRKKIAATVAFVLLVLSMPMDMAYAEPADDMTSGEITVKCDGKEVTDAEIVFTDEEFANSTIKQLEVSVKTANGEEIDPDNGTVEWRSTNSQVVMVEAGKLTPVSAGVAKLICERKYNTVTDGDVTTTIELSVKVYERPELIIDVNPADTATYPQEVTISVAGYPDGVIPTLTIDDIVQDNAYYTGVLDKGKHTIKASTEADGYYVESETIYEYTVNEGETEFVVEATKEDSIFYSESVIYTVTTSGIPGNVKATVTNGTIMGSSEYRIEDNSATAVFDVKYDEVIGNAAITFEYTPDNSNYGKPANITKSITVNKIPVKAVWNDSFTKTYDGKDSYIPNDSVTLELAGATDILINATVSIDNVNNIFKLDAADAGIYTASYQGILTITDTEHYELVETQPTQEITVKPVELSPLENIISGEGTGKSYDGDSVAKFITEPTLSDAHNFVDNEFTSLKLGYTANYYNNGQQTFGHPGRDVEVTEIVLSNLSVINNDGTINNNYIFPIGSSYTLNGYYVITKNDDFEVFTKIDLGDSFDGVYWFNEDFKLGKTGYEFATVDKPYEWWHWQQKFYSWSEELHITSRLDGKAIVARKDGDRFISGEIVVGYDDVLPNGSVWASVDGQEKSITDLVETYNTIENDSIIEIIVQAGDNKSKIKQIEWYATDVPVSSNDVNSWPTTGTITIPIGEEYCKHVIATIDKTELKSFYYARITDNAGNISYISSSGVLQDTSDPIINSLNLGDADANYNGVGVYKEGIVDFSINMSESGITSGISDVQIVLQLNDMNPEIYDITSDIWTVSDGDAVSSIRNLKRTTYPNAKDIDNASGNLTVDGTLSDLAEGNKYTLTAIAYDKAGNASMAVSKQFIVDTSQPVAEIDISGLQYNENRLGEDIYTQGTVRVSIEDMTLVTDYTTLMQELEGVSWETVTAPNGLVKYVATIPFGKNTVNTDGGYSLEIEAEDCFDRTDNYEQKFNIDDSAPVYIVEFSNVATEATKIGNTQYYNTDIVAKFKIIEEGSYIDSLVNIVVKDDAYNTVMEWNSGKASTVTGNDNYILNHEEGSKEFILTIKADVERHSTDNKGYSFMIYGTDKAGNPICADETVGTAIFDIRAMDTIAPELTEVTYDTINAFKSITNDKTVKDYVSADTLVNFTLVEENSIISTYSLTSEGGNVSETKWNQERGNNTYKAEFVVSQFGLKGDEQILELAVKDVAGNNAVMSAIKRSAINTTFVNGRFTDRFTVDKVAPSVKYEYIDYNPNRPNVSGVDYFNRPVEVLLTVDEHNFDETQIMIGVDGYGPNVTYQETPWTWSHSDVYTKKVYFSADSEYSLSVKGHDCAGNLLLLNETGDTSVVSAEPGDTCLKVAIDQTIPSIGDTAKPVVVISPAAAGSTSATNNQSGHALYNNSIVYEVAIYDPEINEFCSGIDGITFEVSAENGSSARATVGTNGSIVNGRGLTVTMANGNSTNLGRGKENQYIFTVSIDKEYFNSNAIMLGVSTRDFSTNTAYKTASPVAIDTTAPIVNISYNNNDVSNEKYFNKEREVTVEVIERNFSDDCVVFTVNGENVELKFSNISAGSGNRDDAVYRATYTFNQDGDFVVGCTAKDRAGNVGSVNYTGTAVEEFTIDLTLPIITVSYDNKSATNDYYFSEARTATIRVEEHNFNSAEVVITGTATENGAEIVYPEISRWSTRGDIHEATIYYATDAKYTLDVAYVDMATNAADSPETSQFVIDTKDPELTIIGVENGRAYADEVIPQIEFSDNNYADVVITLTRTERDKQDVDVTNKFVNNSTVVYSASGRGEGKNIIADIEHITENDGIYTLTATVFDKAGRTTEESVTYSVNRFGSVYVYSKDLTNLIGGYYQEITGDLYIMAYNANELANNATKLQITCDGSILSNQKSVANAEENLVRDNGWYVYKFDIDVEDFISDGSYEITLSDKDMVGNTKTNSDMPIQFYVDNTAPVLDSVIGLEESIINAESQTVEYVISDAIGLENISVYINDALAVSVDEFEVATYHAGHFEVGAGVRQSIRIVATDKAGNTLDSATEGFKTAFAFSQVVTISTNTLVRWYADSESFWGSIVGIGGVLVLGTWIMVIIIKRKKKGKENIEVF